jgi:cytochrome c-type biogenesis protein CcmH
MALLVPLAAAGLYFHFGGWADWNIQRLLDRSEQQLRAGDDNRATLTALTAALERRLAQRDDDDGRRRFMLARIDAEFGRFDAALVQYRRLLQQFPDDPEIAAQYAQSLYLASGRKLTAEVVAQARKAVAGNPDQVTALGLLGIDAFERRDYADAVLYWRHLRRLLPPGSADAGAIDHGIRQAEQALGPAGFPGPKITVSVSLAPALAATAPSGATLFVFARAVGGAPMPLAVARLDAAHLPLEVTLDDSMAMAPGANLSSAKRVEVVARITGSGQVRAGPGDLEGSSAPLTLDGGAQQLSLQIDRRL